MEFQNSGECSSIGRPFAFQEEQQLLGQQLLEFGLLFATKGLTLHTLFGYSHISLKHSTPSLGKVFI
jgi:hypothetical protein